MAKYGIIRPTESPAASQSWTNIIISGDTGIDELVLYLIESLK